MIVARQKFYNAHHSISSEKPSAVLFCIAREQDLGDPRCREVQQHGGAGAPVVTIREQGRSTRGHRAPCCMLHDSKGQEARRRGDRTPRRYSRGHKRGRWQAGAGTPEQCQDEKRKLLARVFTMRTPGALRARSDSSGRGKTTMVAFCALVRPHGPPQDPVDSTEKRCFWAKYVLFFVRKERKQPEKK